MPELRVIILVVLLAILVLVVCSLPLVATLSTTLDVYFQGVSALFAGLGFIVVAATLYLQFRELRRQAKVQEAADRHQRSSRLWETFNLVTSLYKSSPDPRDDFANLRNQIVSIRIPNTEKERDDARVRVAKLVERYPTAASGLILLSTLCDVILSDHFEGMEAEMLRFGTLLAGVLGIDKFDVLVDIGARTDQSSFMSLIATLNKYANLTYNATPNQIEALRRNVKSHGKVKSPSALQSKS